MIIIKFQEPAEYTLQDQLNTNVVNTSDIECIHKHTNISTLHETLPEYYQHLGQLLTIKQLCVDIYQQEIDRLLKNFRTKVLHTYNLSIHTIDLVKEYH